MSVGCHPTGALAGLDLVRPVADKVSSVAGGQSVTGVRRCANLGGGAVARDAVECWYGWVELTKGTAAGSDRH
jgi:hypothetical protein